MLVALKGRGWPAAHLPVPAADRRRRGFARSELLLSEACQELHAPADAAGSRLCLLQRSEKDARHSVVDRRRCLERALQRHLELPTAALPQAAAEFDLLHFFSRLHLRSIGERTGKNHQPTRPASKV